MIGGSVTAARGIMSACCGGMYGRSHSDAISWQEFYLLSGSLEAWAWGRQNFQRRDTGIERACPSIACSDIRRRRRANVVLNRSLEREIRSWAVRRTFPQWFRNCAFHRYRCRSLHRLHPWLISSSLIWLNSFSLILNRFHFLPSSSCKIGPGVIWSLLLWFRRIYSCHTASRKDHPWFELTK